jgi:hypothetical protein
MYHSTFTSSTIEDVRAGIAILLDFAFMIEIPPA